MKPQHRQAAMILLPAAMAGLLAVGSPWLPGVGSSVHDSSDLVAAQDVYRACRDRLSQAGRPQGASAAPLGATERTQRPGWVQQAEADMERCLREGLGSVSTAQR